MIAVDTNLLVYAHRRDSVHHREARAVLERLIEGHASWTIPWPCCFEFLSVVTNRRIWKTDATRAEVAWGQFASMAASPSNRVVGPTRGFLEILPEFMCRPRVRGRVVHDAHIAAICVAHGVDVLFTCDRDFSLFPELRTHNPLRGSGGC